MSNFLSNFQYIYYGNIVPVHAVQLRGQPSESVQMTLKYTVRFLGGYYDLMISFFAETSMFLD